jgi:hypothetical protein
MPLTQHAALTTPTPTPGLLCASSLSCAGAHSFSPLAQVEGLGIASVARLFEDFGYSERDELSFPAKKLRARWYSPPDPELPRVFVSELKARPSGWVGGWVGGQ